jgi:hypothetical protein
MPLAVTVFRATELFRRSWRATHVSIQGSYVRSHIGRSNNNKPDGESELGMFWFDSGSLDALRSVHAVRASPFFESTLCGIVLSSVSSATSCLTSTGSEMLGPSLRKRPFIVQGRNLRNSIMQRHELRYFSQMGSAAKPNRSVTKWQDLALL